jgi:hypothetical protein
MEKRPVRQDQVCVLIIREPFLPARRRDHEPGGRNLPGPSDLDDGAAENLAFLQRNAGLFDLFQ